MGHLVTKQITNAVLAEKIDQLTDLVRTHVTADEKHFVAIGDFINGNGSVGAKTRIDRLEQAEKSRTFHVRTIWAALVSTIVGVAVNWVWY